MGGLWRVCHGVDTCSEGACWALHTLSRSLLSAG